MQVVDSITGSSLPFELGTLISKRLAHSSPLSDLRLSIKQLLELRVLNRFKKKAWPNINGVWVMSPLSKMLHLLLNMIATFTFLVRLRVTGHLHLPSLDKISSFPSSNTCKELPREKCIFFCFTLLALYNSHCSQPSVHMHEGYSSRLVCPCVYLSAKQCSLIHSQQ